MNYCQIEKYCDKCGKIWQGNREDPNEVCQICKNHLKIVPDEYYNNPNFKVLLSEDMEQKLINDLVLTSPNFDQYFFDHREEIKEQQDREYYDNIAYCKAIMEGKSRVPKCPTCQSTNVQKIGFIDRATSIAFWGIFSKKINKSFKCNDCGYTW